MKLTIKATDFQVHIDNDQGEEVLDLSYANYHFDLDLIAAIRGAGPIVEAILSVKSIKEAKEKAAADVTKPDTDDGWRQWGHLNWPEDDELPAGVGPCDMVEYRTRDITRRTGIANRIGWSISLDQPSPSDIVAYRVLY